MPAKPEAMPTPRRFAGQSAIVTGGARGIGLGIAERLAREGARVAIWDRDLAPLARASFKPALEQQSSHGEQPQLEQDKRETAPVREFKGARPNPPP